MKGFCKQPRIIQCMKTKRGVTCALPAGHKGVCGFDRPQSRRDVAWDKRRHGAITKLHRADPKRN